MIMRFFSKVFPQWGPSAFLALFVFCGKDALATRKVNFSAQGQNILGQSDGITYLVTGSTLNSGCNISMVNNSQQNQTVYYYIRLIQAGSVYWQSDTGGITGSGTAIKLGPFSGAASGYTECCPSSSCSGNASPYCTINQEFAAVVTSVTPGTNVNGGVASPKVTSVLCEGWIKVDDTTSTAVGFITATGALTTYAESPPATQVSGTAGGFLHRSTTSPTVTQINIGEGRPF